MTADPASADSQRPRDFTARYARARHETLGKTLRRPRVRRRNGKLALCLLGTVALPAFASTGDWDRFHIGDAQAGQVELEPMPFEKAGSSFPGSAFYYLQMDEPGAEPAFGEGIRSDADIDRPADRLDPGPAARSMRVDNSGVDRTRALDCLTAAIYYEAASEADSGQRSVAQVVLNRVAHPAYPNTVCGVVYQGSQRQTGCQFSFTCDGSLARRPSRMFWLRAENVARAALAGYVHRPAGLATHYHTTQIYPYWAPSLDYLGTIGAHRFYRFKGNAGRPGSFRFDYLGGEPAAIDLRGSDVARTSSAALDPVALQRAYDPGIDTSSTAGAVSAAGAVEADRDTPAPVYTDALRNRGGDALYKAESLPDGSGVREQYRNSGKWIVQPGA